MVAFSSRASTWILAALLGLVAVRLAVLLARWRRGALPGTRLLLPAVVLAEGLGLLLSGGTSWVLRLRLGTALALELLLAALAMRAWRQAVALPGVWPETRIAAAFEAFVPPRAARLMALELVMLAGALRFLLGGFRDPAPVGFSHYRESALRSLLPALPLLLPGDVLLLHALSPHLAPGLRWVLHASTAYAVLWLFGLYASIKARPHQVQDGEVRLHQGLVKSVAFPAASVRSVAPLPDFDDDWARHAHLQGVARLVATGAPQLELALAAPVRVDGMLGPGRPTQRLLVSVDDPAAFRTALGC
ncbi:hypothetical protein [Geothrix terrae]|uniref:hypothetical protein n=1 Tax=Geothrix terrae TaxID=2922720 RepID=UPI001FAC88A3|nr:hypothetical protein [Geothrix terrae]